MLKIRYKGKNGGGSDSPTSLITGAGTVFPYSVELMREYSYFDRFKEPYVNYKVIGKETDHPKIMVPRGLYPVADKDNRVAGNDIKFKFIGKPRNDEQVRVLKEVNHMLMEGSTGFIVNASTGFGKTFVGCHAIAKIGKPTIVLITKADLKKQWTQSFKDFLGLENKDIGLIKGDVYDVMDKKVVIGFVQSVMKDGRYPSWVYKQFGFVISDECFHPTQELLTLRGWVLCSEVKATDKVAQIDFTGAINYAIPEKIISKDFDGYLINIVGRNCDLLATPTHQHYGLWNGQTPMKVDYANFKPKSRLNNVYASYDLGGEVILSPHIRLSLAHQADGCLVYTNKKGIGYYRFAFRKTRKIIECRGLLTDCGLDYKETVNRRGDTCFTFKMETGKLSKSLSWLSEYYGSGSGFAKAIIRELPKWDGWITPSTTICIECGEDNAEYLQIIGVLAGYRTSKAIVKKLIRVSFSPNAIASGKALQTHRMQYTGKVHCVRMPQGTVVVRRNGKVAITGNCHLMGADKFVNCMFLLPAKYRLGLSATIDRADGKAHVFKDHIGKGLIKAELLPMEFDVVKVVTGIKAPHWVKFTAGRTMALNNYLGGVKGRQLLITQKIKAALAKDRHIVCFADTLKHLQNAYDALINEGVPHSKIGFYVGGLSDGEAEVAAHKQVVLTTYKMCQYGTDYPHWDTAMLMTPRSDVRQIVGRILRESEGKTNPVVFDFVDNIKLLHAYWGSRYKWYRVKADRVVGA